MSTLVYSPEITVRIATQKGEVVDVSEDVVRGSVSRVINGVSSFEFSLLNAARKYDNMFTPMDRVVCYLRRLRPLLVFSGYLNSVPIFQAFPGSLNLRASCTLKRLQHFYWDPGSPAAVALFNSTATTTDDGEINDGGMALRAQELLVQVAGWSKEQIHIGRVPDKWFDLVEELASRVIEDAEAARLAAIVGSGSTIGGSNPSSGQFTSIPGIGIGTGKLPATSGKISYFGTEATGAMALTGEYTANPIDPYYCLPADAQVYAEHRPVSIADIEIGQRVWAFDGEGLSLAPVTGKIATGIKPTWQVRTLNHTIRSTEDHRLLVLSREGTRKNRRAPAFEWLRAAEVRVGDVLVTTSGMPETTAGEHPSEDMARLVGLLVADGTRNTGYRIDTTGHFHGGPKRHAVCLPQPEQRARWAPLIEQTLGVAVSQDPDRCCLSFSTNLIQRWSAEVMQHKSPDRFVPDWVWTAPRKIQEAFLDGYLAGDGSFGQTARTQGTETVACTSQRLAREVRVLCHYLGFRTGNLSSYTSTGFANGRRMHRFVFYRQPTRRQVPSSYARDDLGLNEMLAGRTVLASEPTGERQPTYDIEVDGPGSFVAEGVVVHNCAMRWPYTNDAPYGQNGNPTVTEVKNWWKNRRILVVNPKNNKACIVRAADWGPASWTGRAIDVSPAAFRALGVGTDDNVQIAFAEKSGKSADTGPVSASELGQVLEETNYNGAGLPDPPKGNWGPHGQISNMRTVKMGGKNVTVHKMAVERFQGFVRDLIDIHHYHPQSIGGFNDRTIAGTSTWSNHAYGAAIDIDPSRNPYYSSAQGGPHAIPNDIVPTARKWGLGWGGEWNNSKDYMHFEVLGAPASGSYDNVKPSTEVAVEKWLPPFKDFVPITNHFGDPGDYASGYHTGTDFNAIPEGAPVHPVGPGKVDRVQTGDAAYGNNVSIFHGNGVWTMYAHMTNLNVREGQDVTVKDVLGHEGETGNTSGVHLHLELRLDSDTYTSSRDKKLDIEPYLIGGPNRPDPPRGVGGTAISGGAGGGAGGSDLDNLGAAIFNVWQWIQSPTELGMFLTGYRAIMNDVPVLNSVEQYLTSSLRDFCSAPNGDFIAWFPDYFGLWGQAGKMVITPLEIQSISGAPTIGWDDTNLKTHQFVSSATLNAAQDASSMLQMATTAGIASVEFPELMAALFKVDPEDFEDGGAEFLARYGARPNFLAMNEISGPEQEFFFACHEFMRNWAQQYQTSINLTFMPELYPGMLACFPIYGVQGYVEEVTHSFDLSDGGGGFTTSFSASPWSTIGPNGPDGLPKGAAL